MAGGGPPPGRRAERPLLRVRRARGGIGQEGDRLARRAAETTWWSSAPRAGRPPTWPRSSRAGASPPPTSPGAWSRWGLGTDDPARRRERTRSASGRCSASDGGASRTSWRGERTPSWSTLTGGSTPTAALLEREGLRLRAVFDTHLHADHVSGGPALARDAGVGYHASLRDFEGGTDPRRGAGRTAGPCGSAGSRSCPSSRSGLRATRRAAPRSSSRDALLLTGDTLFVDDVGRPDLGGQAAAWARDLHRTLHERLRPLGDAVVVLPAHASEPGGGRVRTAPSPARSATSGAGTARCGSTCDAFVRRPSTPPARRLPSTRRIRAINLGRETAAETELTELELGKNQCALSRR